ncbi:transcription factor CSA isoform X1 [Musa acuminata AAA Group]|uniref:transcription factor CSA isoform X1 n=1 Tax=Musa acuminata AAA Group TaxID=214697 RepID=UPI0031D2C412
MGFFAPVAPPFVHGLTGEHENHGKVEEDGERQHKLCARGHWRPAEDAKLKELVSQHGPRHWNLIAEKLAGRTGKSCRLRWFNQLDPRINKKAFSEEEEERLLVAHRLYGNRWALIARIFPGRTDNAVKNHWHVTMARKQREQCSCAYRRRRKPFLCSAHSPPSQHSLPNVACSGESTITSTRDECASARADLSLGSFTSSTGPSNGMLNGSDERLVSANDGFCDKLGNSGGGFLPHVNPMLMLVPGFGQSGCTCSTPRASAAAEPPAYHMSLPHGKTDHGRKNTELPFFDFLGVGAR